ncbi:MAG: hypothetical protein C0603_08595 [Denitrovibrio sp.]|nr:MAG: hypothetical protein C0603_08595 [Denitrovibrio sp.]
MKCFLSHNSKDKDTAEDIGKKLIDHGIDIWFDKWEIFAGESIISKISDGIDSCSAFVILLSNNSVNAEWVKEELRIAIRRRINENYFVLIPVLLEDCSIPAFLRDYAYLDWRSGQFDVEDLVRNIRRVSLKPDFVITKPITQIVYNSIIHEVKFTGYRGEKAYVKDTCLAFLKGKIDQVDRCIYYSGYLTNASSDLFSIHRKDVGTKHETWELVPKSNLPIQEEFQFNMRYLLHNSFNDEDEFWNYTIESPTEYICVKLDFRNANLIGDVSVYLREGSKSHYEETQPNLTSGVYIWEKLSPSFKDTYEFKFKWKAKSS